MLTKKQRPIFDYIKKYINKNGYGPSLQEIRRRFKLSSIATVHQHIENLSLDGYIKRVKNKPRSIELCKKQKTFGLIGIPLLGAIAAGLPIEAIEDKETIAVPRTKILSNVNIFALRVRGNSMIEENINDGDVVLVKQQSTAENGQKVVALIDNYGVTLKKFYKERGYIRLQPANKTIEPIIIKKDKELIIQGVVIDVIKNGGGIQTTDSLPQKIIKRSDALPLNQIICGDAVNIMESMPDCSIDLTVTSPPYDALRNYNGYNFDFNGIAKSLYRITKKGGVLVWVVGDKIKNGNKSLTSFRQALSFQEIGFNVHDVMIYKKKNTPFMRTNAYTNCFEFMFVLSRGKPKTFNPLKVKTIRQGQEMLPFNKGADGINKKILKELKPEKTMINIWEYAVGLHGTTSDRIAFRHPAIFPEKLAENHILSWTNREDIVFDPMCGSGTTCKMALKNNRFYIGCDISREYVEIAIQRLEMLRV